MVQLSLIQPTSQIQIIHLLVANIVNQLGNSGFLKQLEVQPDHDLSRRNLVEQQPLCDWPFGTLVLFNFSQTDLCPAQEI